MGLEAFGEIPEGLCGHNGAGLWVRLGSRGLDEALEGLPAAAAQVGPKGRRSPVRK